jgi:DnaJ like chaperone protein
MKKSKIYNILLISAYILPMRQEQILASSAQHIADFIGKNYGYGTVADSLKVLDSLIDQKTLLESNSREDVIYQELRDAAFLLSNGTYENRMGLLAFFIGLSIEVEHIDIDKLHNVAMILGLAEEEVDIILEMINPRSEESPKERALRILELPIDATEDEIKSAYRRLSLKYHPDRNVNKSISEQKAAERKFKEIVAAKETLDQIIHR